MTRSRWTSSSSTSAVPSCPRRTGASWSGCSPGGVRGAFPGEIAELSYPPRVVESYTHELLRCIDMTGVREAGLKVVADCAGGTASLVLPSLLGTIGVEVLTLNNRLDELSPTETTAQQRAGLQRLADVVSSSRAAFGVRFDPVGERIQLVDEKGELVSENRALLAGVNLVAAERKRGRVALPVTTTRVAEQMCRFHGVQVDGRRPPCTG